MGPGALLPETMGVPGQPSESQTLYEILGVPRTASAADIRAAYRARIFEVHPDRSDSPEAYESTRLILEAWRVLGDEEERHRYDATLPKPNREDARASRVGKRVVWSAAIGAAVIAIALGVSVTRDGGTTQIAAADGKAAGADTAGSTGDVLDLDLAAIPAGEFLAVPEAAVPRLEPLPEMPMPRLDSLPEIPVLSSEPMPDLPTIQPSVPGEAVSATRRQEWSERLDLSREDLGRLYVLHAELITRLGQFRAALDSPGLTFVQAYPVLQRIEQARVAISETERAMANYRKEIEGLELLLDDARTRARTAR